MAININGRSLVPNIAGQFALGQQTSNTLDNQRLQGQVQQFNLDRAKAGVLGDQQAARQKTQNQQLAGSLIGGNFKGQERQKKIGELFAANPDLAAKTLTQLGVQDQAGADEYAQWAFEFSRANPEGRAALVNQRADAVTARGGDPKDTLSMLNLNEDQQNQVAETIQLAALSVKDRMAQPQKKRDAQIKEEGLKLRRLESELRRSDIESKKLDQQLVRETNVIKKDELQQKVNANKVKAEQAKRDLDFNVRGEVSAAQNGIDTIDRALKGDALESATGIEANFPTISGSPASNFEQALETIQSQAFLTQVQKMKGMGALSENEGRKLGAAIGSLSLDMGDKELRSELNRIKGVMQKAKQSIMEKYNLNESDTTDGAIIVNKTTGERMQLVNGKWETL